jgi:hypothetical protein
MSDEAAAFVLGVIAGLTVGMFQSAGDAFIEEHPEHKT